jgi:hypothetical protein
MGLSDTSDAVGPNDLEVLLSAMNLDLQAIAYFHLILGFRLNLMAATHPGPSLKLTVVVGAAVALVVGTAVGASELLIPTGRSDASDGI